MRHVMDQTEDESDDHMNWVPVGILLLVKLCKAFSAASMHKGPTSAAARMADTGGMGIWSFSRSTYTAFVEPGGESCNVNDWSLIRIP